MAKMAFLKMYLFILQKIVCKCHTCRIGQKNTLYCSSVCMAKLLLCYLELKQTLTVLQLNDNASILGCNFQCGLEGMEEGVCPAYFSKSYSSPSSHLHSFSWIIHLNLSEQYCPAVEIQMSPKRG